MAGIKQRKSIAMTDMCRNFCRVLIQIMDLPQIFPPAQFDVNRTKALPPLDIYSGDFVYAYPPVLPQANPWTPDAFRGKQAKEWFARVKQPWDGATMAANRQLQFSCWYNRQEDFPFVEDEEEESTYFVKNS